MPQPTIQLDQYALRLVRDVVKPESAGDGRRLSSAGGQAVGSLHVAEEPHLHDALRALADVGQDVDEQTATTMPAPGGKKAQKRRLGGGAAMKPSSQEGKDVRLCAQLSEVQQGVLDVDSPWPVQLIHVGVGIDPPMNGGTGRSSDAAARGHGQASTAQPWRTAQR